jgi:UPF0755 protein
MSDVDLESSRPHRRQKPPREGHGGTVALIAVLLIGGLVAGGWFGLQALLSRFDASGEDYAGPGSGEVVVEVTSGQSSSAIGRLLKEKGVVASVQAFADAARAEPRSQSLQPGFYSLKKQMSADDALATMLDPQSRVESRVTVPEGLRVEETLRVLAKGTGIPLREFTAALKDPEAIGLPAWAAGNPEGFLFPATYTVPPDAKATDVLAMMLARFDDAVTQARLDADGKTAYETLIIASILEEEAKLPDDYGKVARVIQNRLDIDMPLQFNSPLNYFLKHNRNLTLDELETETPYNTYKYGGLPPAPIGSPGERAMEAAANPTPGDWIYFVTTNLETGETKFTTDYDEFLEFKAEFKANTEGQ